MKHIYYILLVTLILFSCKEEDYFRDQNDESLNTSMWSYLETDSSHSYFMTLVDLYHIDEVISDKNPITLFIPSDEELKQLDTTDLDVNRMLNYLVIPTLVNVQSVYTAEKVQTKSLKFALIENDEIKGNYTYDGVSITNSSALYNDGRYYELEDVVIPAPNLYEYISETSQVFKYFIDIQDSVYFDIDESDPIGFSLEGTVYDSVFSTENLFSTKYFPVEEEYRNTTATFTIFTQEQYDVALEIMKLDLGTDDIPMVWQSEVLLPTLILNSIFGNSLQFSDFQERMVNVVGDSVSVPLDNIDVTSRTICSNGVVFTLSDFVIPDSLYKAQSIIRGQDLVVEVMDGEEWLWADDVLLEGMYATSVVPELLGIDAADNEKVLAVDLSDTPEDTLRFTFVRPGVFGAENYRLIWAGSKNYCGLYKIYINGVALEMRNYANKSQDYFDSFEFSKTVIKTATAYDEGNFKGNGSYNMIDFEIDNITEYSDVEITFEYLGSSKNSKGVIRAPAGLVIDYLKLEMYE